MGPSDVHEIYNLLLLLVHKRLLVRLQLLPPIHVGYFSQVRIPLPHVSNADAPVVPTSVWKSQENHGIFLLVIPIV